MPISLHAIHQSQRSTKDRDGVLTKVEAAVGDIVADGRLPAAAERSSVRHRVDLAHG